MKRSAAPIVLLLSCFSLFAGAQENWPRFRGSSGNPSIPDAMARSLPVDWDKEKNVAWDLEIPGVGWSGPVIWGNKVFVTTVENDLAKDNEQPKKGLYLGQGRRGIPSGKHHWWVYCLDLESGKILWKQEALAGEPRTGRHPKSSYAAETPVVDAERVYALFGDHGLYCFDHDGNPQWKHEIETKETMANYGAAASPALHEDLVLYVYDNSEASYIAALDAKTGDQRWKTSREEKSTWATPFVWKNPVRTEIVVTGKKRNRSYDLKGNVLWEMDGKMSNLVIPSPFEADGLLYIASGYFQDRNRPGMAIKPGASGDITLVDEETSNEFVQWFQPKAGPYNTTPLVHEGIYYLLLDQGMMSTYDAKTGEQFYDRVRFPRGATFTVAPWAYKGKIFCLAENGKTYVLEAGKEFKLVGENDLDELCMACPAIAQGRLIVRTLTKLYCFTEK